jgi:hypothetical protein
MNLFKWFKRDMAQPALDRADKAIRIADELTNAMRHYRSSNDAVESLIIDLRRHRRNIPFITTVYEAIQEAKPYPHS